MDAVPNPSAIVEFGRFKVLRYRRELFADDRPIDLGGRAFDTLVALIDAQGTVLDKDELMSRVWPGRVVEENSLQAQISVLRRMLGPDRDLIRTVAGRGYQFTGEIRGASVVPVLLHPVTNLPGRISELIGREAALGEVADLVTTHRLVTLTGVGGIGKTRLGLEVARHLLPRFPDGVWLAELGPLSDPELVPVNVANALGLALATGTVSPERVTMALGTKQVLLVLDNCEHVIEAATRMAEALLRASPVSCVIATSREPLRAEGEYVYRVPPLDVPAENNLDMKDVLRHGAVKLFVARAHAAEPRFMPDIRIASALAGICRHLDGIPLALELELAAARVASFGVEGIASHLDDRFNLLTGGNRTALPRHQTLRASLDWSYELLPESERVVLRRLAIFASGFTLEAASVIARGTAPSVIDCPIANLVSKSLIVADIGGAITRYRLLETTRTYALEKLKENGEFERFTRRHAGYYRDLFERAEAEWETRPTFEWLAVYGREVDNVRAALDWAFSPNGDVAIGVGLTTASVPLWFQLALLDECRVRVERALSSLGSGPNPDARREMKLRAALGGALLYTIGPGPKMIAAWTSVRKIAESLDDTDYQLRALWGLWVAHLTCGEHQSALAHAQTFSSLAAKTTDPVDLLIGDRLIGISLHCLGDQTNARRYLDRILSRNAAPIHRSHTIRFQYDQRVAVRAFLARILWLQGLPDQAMHAAQSCVADAQAVAHALSLCHALTHGACPVALFTGDLVMADRFATMLLDCSAQHGFGVWHALGRCIKSVLVVKGGDLNTGLRLLRAAVDQLDEFNFALYRAVFLSSLAEGLARSGQVAEGLAIINEAIVRSERTEEYWSMAELLRVKGELLLLQCAPDAELTAEDHFQQALDWSRRQEALSWELRSATSLARLWHQQRRTSQARKLLAPVYGRFTEGFGTADLATAKALLESVRQRLPSEQAHST